MPNPKDEAIVSATRVLVLLALFLFEIASFFPVQSADLAPTASFTISPSSGSLQTVFSFDASASYDQRGFSNTLDYRWNFEYGSGGTFTEWSRDDVATHQYTSDGEKNVALEVRDEDGAIDRTISALTVWEEAIYSGWFTVSPTEGDVNTEFKFKANVSSKSSVPTSEYQFRWDFEGDGVYDTDFSYGTTAYHHYGDTGYYNPRLDILSPDGGTLTVIGYDDGDENEVSFVYVTFGDLPQASLQVYPATGSLNTTFYFNASDSFDAQDHGNIDYRWDFEGDGLFDIDWGDQTNPSHRYSTPGTYQAMVQVRDTENNVDETIVTITVNEQNLPPTADFSITSNSGSNDETIGTTNTTFTFNANRSTDEEDSLSELRVRWDFESDGTYDTSFDEEKIAHHRYLDPGIYDVRLEVIDTSGISSKNTQTVTVVSNDPPIPVFDVSPLRGTPGTSFYFDASASRDNQYSTSLLEVRWDFEGNGTYDTLFAVDKTIAHNYSKAGDYTVMLQVRDPEGQTATTSQTIEVIESTAPVAHLTVTPLSGTFSTLFSFDASGSSDGETNLDALWFRWDLDYTGTNDISYSTSWSHVQTKSLRFDRIGEIVVRVEVKDEEENVSTAFATVDVHWASPYMDYLKNKGILKGYSNGNLAPDQSITRAELLKMTLVSTGLSDAGHSYKGYFKDVGKNDWFDGYVEKAYEMGIVSGYDDGSFKPNAPVTRSEAMKIIVEAFELKLTSYENGTFTDVHSWDWFADHVATGYEVGLVGGYPDGTFQPEWTMTRGEASKILALALQGDL